MIIAIGSVLLGFALLIWSADLLVDNASLVAQRLGTSTFLIGIIIVGFGTSAPEMFVSAMAALENKGNLALGNALGSNITNIGLVLGSAAIVRSMPITKDTTRIDLPIVLATGVLAVFLIRDSFLSLLDGLLLLIVLVTYLVWSAKFTTQQGCMPENQDQPPQESTKSTTLACCLLMIAIATLVGSSKLLVNGAVTIAAYFGVGELIIGLTIVAIGTSLPELAAAIAAAKKGIHDMIIGNIIGSNIFNTLGVLGITGVIRSTDIDTSALSRDFPIMFAFTILMLIFAFTKGKFTRSNGVALVIGYTAYVCYLVFSAIK